MLKIVRENRKDVAYLEVTAQDGRILRYSADGSKLSGFREPSKKR